MFLNDLLRGSWNGQPALQSSPEAVVEATPPIDRRGMFGVRGTARDIIGVLGDAFLTQAGRNTVYAPRRQMEREADAQQEFTHDPMSAIERLSRENPAAARDMFNDYQLNQVRQRQQRAADTLFENTTHDRATRLFQGVTEQSWPRVRQQALNYYSARGLTPPVEIPESFDQGFVDMLRSSAVPTDRQIDDDALADYRSEGLNVRRQAINAANTRAAASVAARRDADAARDADRDATREDRRNQNDWFRNYRERYPPGSGRRPRPSNGPATEPAGANERDGRRYRNNANGRVFTVRNRTRYYE